MLQVDFHVHSLFSQCGLHTILELLEKARALGLKGLALTDHGPTLGGKLNSVFFERFKSPFREVVLLKGIECNILDKDGTIDLPESFLPFLDIVLLGIHPNTPEGLSRTEYTEMLISAMEKNACIDIITHPNDSHYPVDYCILAREAARRGVALELNNSRILYSRTGIDETLLFLRACKEERCFVAVCSDTHALHELGLDESVRPLLESVRFPKELIVTESAFSAFDFVKSRAALK